VTHLFTRRQWLAGAGALLVTGPGRAETREDARLYEFLESAFQRDLDRSPIWQSRLGIKTHQDQWDDVSERHRLEDHAFVQQDSKALHRFDFARLSHQAQISYRMFEWLAKDNLEAFRWRRNEYLVTQMGGLHTWVLTTLVNSHPIGNLADAETYIARLRGVDPLMRQLVIELQRQESAGVTPPRFAYALAIDACENALKGRPFSAGGADSPLLADFKGKLEKTPLTEEQRAALLSRAEAALRNRVGPGYRDLIEHLQQAERSATDIDGVWKLPRGDAYYRWRLLSATTLTSDPAQIHALGLRQVERIHGEMSTLAAKSGFSGTLRDYFSHVQQDPQNYYPDTPAGRQQYVADAESLLEQVRARENEFLGRKPKAAVIVRAVEAWRAKSAPKAFYRSAPADGSSPGIFYVNLYDLQAAPKYQLPAILYHEAVPGHHVETVIAHELHDLPRFRRFASISAFSEGWGLYSERLAAELGLYRDPLTEFGRLSLELMRACRLVVDTGIHAMRWSRTHGVTYLDRNMPSSHYDNQREVDRYIVLPGQATSYYVGMLKILELRDEALKKLTGKFDLRSFHDAVLENGPLPLGILQSVVSEWADAQAAH
jgi:uncharacterized protein (DUF885 family)